MESGSKRSVLSPIHADAAKFYRDAITQIMARGIPFIIGGAFALEWHTGVPRRTKDLDILTTNDNCKRILDVLAEAGYKTELLFPHWLGKVYSGDSFIDVIFNSGNGLHPVNQSWFEHAMPGEFLSVKVPICSPIDLILSKAFVMERERFDGADIIHLLRCCGASLNWLQLVERFGAHRPVLFSHLVLFRYVYPTEQKLIPDWVMKLLWSGVDHDDGSRFPERFCRGTLLSRQQYLIDIEQWGARDARLPPWGDLSQEDIDRWTAPVRRADDLTPGCS